MENRFAIKLSSMKTRRNMCNEEEQISYGVIQHENYKEDISVMKKSRLAKELNIMKRRKKICNEE